jgi:6-pyruvoyltetrahydropterin/6-carboxytetrahydropterin synthase
MRLMREIRFSLLPEAPAPDVGANSWAGRPGAAAMVPYVVLRAVVSGRVDPATGYLCPITMIDRLLRERAVPILQSRFAECSGRFLPAPTTLAQLWEPMRGGLPRGLALEELRLNTTPYLSFAAWAGGLPMIRMTQSFEFSASHRLHCPQLSDEENRRVFGKCNNPHGHGHNYVVDVTIEGDPDPQTGVILGLPGFEAAVKERVIDRFDHKHLNADCPEFAARNPSVENITRTVWDHLVTAFPGCRLCSVRVWETSKTYAEYDGK